MLSTLQVLCVTSVELDGVVAVSAKISNVGLALRAVQQPRGGGWGPVAVPCSLRNNRNPTYMAPEVLGLPDPHRCVQVSFGSASGGHSVRCV